MAQSSFGDRVLAFKPGGEDREDARLACLASAFGDDGRREASRITKVNVTVCVEVKYIDAVLKTWQLPRPGNREADSEEPKVAQRRQTITVQVADRSSLFVDRIAERREEANVVLVWNAIVVDVNVAIVDRPVLIETVSHSSGTGPGGRLDLAPSEGGYAAKSQRVADVIFGRVHLPQRRQQVKRDSLKVSQSAGCGTRRGMG